MVVFKAAGGERILLGEDGLDDKAIGEEVEVTIGQSPLVRYQLKAAGNNDARDFVLTVSNASGRTAQVEVTLDYEDNRKLRKASEKLRRKDGKDLWKVTVPANGERVLTYRVVGQ